MSDHQRNRLWDFDMNTSGTIIGVSISSDISSVTVVKDDDGNLIWRYKTDGAIQSVAMSLDCSFIAAGSKDNSVYLFNRDGVLLWEYKTGGEVNNVSVSSDGSYIAVGSQDKEIYFFKFDIKGAGKLKTSCTFFDYSKRAEILGFEKVVQATYRLMGA